ncbi:MAG: hypothetical protein E6K96_03860 [Thaumarchaeota archaeon]|nr:MAG: hypothetical protein E6K96_03860 [Nitrososphaerota archaeon]
MVSEPGENEPEPEEMESGAGEELESESEDELQSKPEEKKVRPEPEQKGVQSQPGEVILTQEQSVDRGSGGKEQEGGFGAGLMEGTLVLTNKRLVFVTMGEAEEDLSEPTDFNPFGKLKLFYSDAEDLKSIPADPDNLIVPLASITSVKGQKGNGAKPKLEVKWLDGRRERRVEFSQRLTGKRTRNLDDWARTVEKLRKGKQPLISLPKAPGIDTLQGQVLRVLSDSQEKGILAIEHLVEDAFKIDLDPDKVKVASEKLTSAGLVKRRRDAGGESFYHKLSPLGDDNLSA